MRILDWSYYSPLTSNPFCERKQCVESCAFMFNGTYSWDLSDFNRAHLRLLLLLLRAGVLAKDQFTVLLISFALTGISACTVTLTRESLRCAALSVIFPISTPREHSFRIFLSSAAGTFRDSFAFFFFSCKKKKTERQDKLCGAQPRIFLGAKGERRTLLIYIYLFLYINSTWIEYFCGWLQSFNLLKNEWINLLIKILSGNKRYNEQNTWIQFSYII